MCSQIKSCYAVCSRNHMSKPISKIGTSTHKLGVAKVSSKTGTHSRHVVLLHIFYGTYCMYWASESINLVLVDPLHNNMQFLYSALSSYELKALYILLPPTHLYTPTFSTPQRSIQPEYTLQGATGGQCTIALSAYCQVHIYRWVNRGTFRVQVLPRDCIFLRSNSCRHEFRWCPNKKTLFSAEGKCGIFNHIPTACVRWGRLPHSVLALKSRAPIASSWF